MRVAGRPVDWTDRQTGIKINANSGPQLLTDVQLSSVDLVNWGEMWQLEMKEKKCHTLVTCSVYFLTIKFRQVTNLHNF